MPNKKDKTINPESPRKPDWLRVKYTSGDQFRDVRKALSSRSLHTVCEEASCPNKAECWSSGTATFMLLGDTCTRGCAFCGVSRGNPGGHLDQEEPQRVAEAAAEMGLEFVVLTSVTRDDLPDGGASIFAETVRRIRALDNSPRVEVLIPDLTGDALEILLEAKPDVIAHNIEVVERLSDTYRHERFDFEKSLEVLAEIRRKSPETITKSSIMLGLGESDEEVENAMRKLVSVGVGILVIGQYLSPSREHLPVTEYVPPEKFDYWEKRGREIGFDFVASGPFVRTSYRAAEAYVERKLRMQEEAQAES